MEKCKIRSHVENERFESVVLQSPKNAENVGPKGANKGSNHGSIGGATR